MPSANSIRQIDGTITKTIIFNKIVRILSLADCTTLSLTEPKDKMFKDYSSKGGRRATEFVEDKGEEHGIDLDDL